MSMVTVVGRIKMPPGVTAADIIIELNTVLRDGTLIHGGSLRATADAEGYIIANGGPVQVPVAFPGQLVDEAPFATFRISYRNAQVRGYDFMVSLMVAPGTSTLNIAAPSGRFELIAPETYASLGQLQTEVQATALELNTLLPLVKLTTAQSTLAAGLIPWTGGDHNTLPAAAGDYRIMRGTEQGQVWTRVSNGAVPTRSSKLEGADVEALAAKAPLVSPVFTGTPTVPTAAPGTSTTQVASTSFVVTAVDALGQSATTALNTKAPLASPAFTGTITQNGTPVALNGHLHTANYSPRSDYSPGTVLPDDVRNVTPDMLAAPGKAFVRFRFGSYAANEAVGIHYADIIDFNTYADSSGGGVNSLALHKDSFRITHKYAPYGATVWTTRYLAYLDEVTNSPTFNGTVTATGSVALNNAPVAPSHATRKDYVDARTASQVPRGSGGNIGFVTTRLGTGAVRENLLPASDPAYFAQDRIGMIDIFDRIVTPGMTADITGVAGFVAGKDYYVADPAGGGPNLAPYPDPLPADFPDASLLNVSKRFYRAGTCFTSAGRTYFTMFADSFVAVSSRAAPSAGESLSLNTWAYNVDLMGGPISLWIQYTAGQPRTTFLKADGDELPAEAAPSAVTRDFSGTVKGVYLFEWNYGLNAVRRLTASPARLGGDILMRFQTQAGNADWSSAQPTATFGMWGDPTNGGHHEVQLSGSGAAPFLTFRPVTYASGVVTEGTALYGGLSAETKLLNGWHWLRVRVNGAGKTVSARFWRDNQAEPAAWTFSNVAAPTLQSGYAGWRSKEFRFRMNRFRTTPDGVAADAS